MYKHILIPTDGSDLSQKAVQQGFLLAKAMKARATSITVISPSQLFKLEPDKFKELPEEYKLDSFATKCLDQVKSATLAQGVTYDVVTYQTCLHAMVMYVQSSLSWRSPNVRAF